jgi:hypothetical protein
MHNLVGPWNMVLLWCQGRSDTRWLKANSQHMVWSHPTRPHTACGREMDDAKSVHRSTAIQQDHILSVAGDGRDRVCAWFCSYPERLRTRCSQAMEDRKSMRGFAPIQQHHVRSVGKRWKRWSQCGYPAWQFAEPYGPAVTSRNSIVSGWSRLAEMEIVPDWYELAG